MTIQPPHLSDLITMSIAIAETLEYAILFLIWLSSTIIIRAGISFFKRKQTPQINLPPSPRAFLPIIGHLHLLAPIPHQALAKLSSHYGEPLFHIYLGSVPCVVASSPEISKEFLKTNEVSFSDRPQTLAIDYLTFGNKGFLTAPHGPYWKFMKKLCMSELLGGRTLDLLQPIRQQEIKHLLVILSQKSAAGARVDIGEEVIRVSNNVISRMLMSERLCRDDKGGEEVRKLICEITDLAGKFNISNYVPFCKNWDLQGFRKQLKEVRDKFDEMMEKIIEEHHTARQRNVDDGQVKDLLHILLDISEDGSSEMKLTRENIKAFIMDIFAAGTDTSATTIEWALAELINHPDILRKAVEEIDSIIGMSNKRLVAESDIPHLPYLQAIVKETLRLHPTTPLIGRQSSRECTIAGYNVPAKTVLLVNVWAMGRDPRIWEDPLEFRPERFVAEEKRKLDVRGQHFNFLPFGSGRRVCPGTSLALNVVHATLAAMIQCFEWKVVETGINGTVDMEEGPGLTLHKARPLVCFPVARLGTQNIISSL